MNKIEKVSIFSFNRKELEKEKEIFIEILNLEKDFPSTFFLEKVISDRKLIQNNKFNFKKAFQYYGKNCNEDGNFDNNDQPDYVLLRASNFRNKNFELKVELHGYFIYKRIK